MSVISIHELSRNKSLQQDL